MKLLIAICLIGMFLLSGCIGNNDQPKQTNQYENFCEELGYANGKNIALSDEKWVRCKDTVITQHAYKIGVAVFFSKQEYTNWKLGNSNGD